MMNDLRKYLKAVIQATTGYRTAYRNIDDEDMYPHCTFVMTEGVGQDINRSDIVLTVDLWAKDTAGINNAADALKKYFKQHKGETDAFVIVTYLMGQEPVEDADKSIQHMVCTYDVRIYEKEQE